MMDYTKALKNIETKIKRLVKEVNYDLEGTGQRIEYTRDIGEEPVEGKLAWFREKRDILLQELKDMEQVFFNVKEVTGK